MVKYVRIIKNCEKQFRVKEMCITRCDDKNLSLI